MKHFLLFYDVATDYLDRRAAQRDAHLEKAWASHRRGELVLGGALVDPIDGAVDGAVLLFRGGTADVAERFAREDPYVVHGLVVRWRVRAWTTVAGAGAASPVVPSTVAATAEVVVDRMWRGRATRANAAAYVEHFRAEVAPGLRATPGYVEATVAERADGDDVEIVVTTRWRSLDDVRAFAGADLEAAVVQPAARVLLRSFDERVVHHVVRYRDR